MPTDRTYDGVNLLPFLTGDEPPRAARPAFLANDQLQWAAAVNTRWATRENDLKLVRLRQAF